MKTKFTKKEKTTDAVNLASSMLKEIDKHDDLRKCRTFGELHDICDANMLGDSEKVLNKYQDSVDDEYISDEWMEVFNEATDIVDKCLSMKGE